MAAALFYLPFPVAFNTNGLPAAGAMVYFYLSGTTTPTPAYTTAALDVPHPNPVVANGVGRIPTVYLSKEITYRVVITDSAGVTLDDSDPYFPPSISAAPAPPVNITLPTLTGDLYVGQTLTASAGTWTHSPTSYTYQWIRNGTGITGATSSTHVIVSADKGTILTVSVAATNADGTVSATSLPTSIPLALLSTPDQRLFTNGVANVVKTTQPTLVTADGTAIGTTSGIPPTLFWAPSALDAQVTLLTSDGNSQRHAVVAANPGTWLTASAFSGGNVTATNGFPDPFGGNAAIKLQLNNSSTGRHLMTPTSPASLPDAANSGWECWIDEPVGGVLDGLRFYHGFVSSFLMSAYDGKPEVIAHSGDCSIAIVETVTVADGQRSHRCIARGEFGTTLADTFYLDYLDGTYLTDTITVPATGDHSIRIHGYRPIDGPSAPLYDWQRSSVWYDSTSVVGGKNNVVSFRYDYAFHDFTTASNTGTFNFIRVMLPATYNDTRATPYPVVIFPKVEPHTAVYASEIDIARTQDFADTFDCIVVDFDTFEYSWAAKAVSGKNDYDTLFNDTIPRFIANRFNVDLNNREDWIAGGYSKSGWAGMQSILRRPDRWGYVFAFDVPYNWTYADLGGLPLTNQFESSAQFNAYRPDLLLPTLKASVQGRKRLTLMRGSQFGTSETAFRSSLTSNSVLFDSTDAYSGTAHNASADWMTYGITNAFAQRAA